MKCFFEEYRIGLHSKLCENHFILPFNDTNVFRYGSKEAIAITLLKPKTLRAILQHNNINFIIFKQISFFFTRLKVAGAAAPD